MISSGKVLYGTTAGGGSSRNGTIFAVKTNGGDFTTIHNFTAVIPSYPGGLYTNQDGAGPQAGLILSGQTLFGTAVWGGSAGNGTVFGVNTDGTGFTTLHSFGPTFPPYYTNSDGANPNGGLILSGNTLFGTTREGGSSIEGTVFSLSIPRPSTISCSGPLVLACTNGGAVGTLEVNVGDSSGNPVVVVWTIDGTPYQTNNLPSGGVLTSTNLTFTADFGLGEHLVTVSAFNGEAPSATCSTTIQVRDTIPPQILSVSAIPNLLWPPNRQMVPVRIEVQAIDNCGPIRSKIVGLTSNEASDSFSDKRGSDWLIKGDLSLDLRAERLGQGQGRIYTVLVECHDVAGNSSVSSVTITVPHVEERPGW